MRGRDDVRAGHQARADRIVRGMFGVEDVAAETAEPARFERRRAAVVGAPVLPPEAVDETPDGRCHRRVPRLVHFSVHVHTLEML